MSGSLAQFLPANIWAMFLVFTRVGAMLGFLPGFGDSYVPQRIRLVLAIGITVAIEPLIASSFGLPAQPGSSIQSFLMIFAEVIVGGFFGISARILMGMLETGGAIIAMQTSLSSAITFNPGAQAQETIPASLLSFLTVALIFTTDLDHMLIRGMVSSYDIFPAGRLPPIADLSDSISHLVSQGFTIAVELAAPFLIVGTAFYVVLGLISRIMTQLQVFYIALPAQLLGGLTMLSLLLVAMVTWFLGKFESIMTYLMRAG